MRFKQIALLLCAMILVAIAAAWVALRFAPPEPRPGRSLAPAAPVINQTGSLPVPFHIRNAPTRLMKELGYGKDYKYAHNYADAVVAQQYLPDKLKGQHFYFPTDRGFEKAIKERLDRWRQLIGKSKIDKDRTD